MKTPLTDAHLERTKINPGPNLWAQAAFARGLERERARLKRMLRLCIRFGTNMPKCLRKKADALLAKLRP